MEIDGNEEDNEAEDPGQARALFHARLLWESRTVGDIEPTMEERNQALTDVMFRTVCRVLPNGETQTIIKGWQEGMPPDYHEMFVLPLTEGGRHRGYIIPTYGLCFSVQECWPPWHFVSRISTPTISYHIQNRRYKQPSHIGCQMDV